jgi:hypothetical protein
MTVRRLPMAIDSFAEIRARSRLGMAMAAMMPMITTAISPRAMTAITMMARVEVRPLAGAATPWPQLGQTGTPGFNWAPHREQNMSSSRSQGSNEI